MTSFFGSGRQPGVSAITAAGWLWSSVRPIAQCWVVVAAIAYAVDLLPQIRDGLSDGSGRALGDDFLNCWSAALLAFQGRAAEVYDFVAFHAYETSVVGSHIGFYHYSYSPVLLLLSLPLAFISYVPALGIWLFTTWLGFYRALLLSGADGVLLLSIATPALFVNALLGQNGALTAALLGGGLLLIDRRPIVAGALLGLLAFKPHLALMLPVALIAGRRWRTVGAAAAMVVLLVSVSAVIFGIDCWTLYGRNLAILRMLILEDGTGVWHRMVSVFVFAKRLGAGAGLAYVLQAASALLASCFVFRSWFRDDPAHLRLAMVVVGNWLATPYLQDYDLVVGAFVVVWLRTAERCSPAWIPHIRSATVAILLLPIAAGLFGKATGLAAGPIVIVPLFVLLNCLAAEVRRGTAPCGVEAALKGAF